MIKNSLSSEEKIKIHEFARELAPIYKLFNWKWAILDSEDGIPEVHNIEHTIRMLYKDLKKSPKTDSVATGGLVASRDGKGCITITWELTKQLYLYG